MPRSSCAAPARDRLPERLCAVASFDELSRAGIDHSRTAAQLAARRWQRIGVAVVQHNGPLTERQRERVALINCGPRAVLTSFTAAARWGLIRWHRDEVHVLAPGGTTRPRLDGLVLHRTRDWARCATVEAPRLHQLAPALLVAAASFVDPRPACGLLAAAVQQRLLEPSDLHTALEQAPRVRHRRLLLAGVGDIAQGAHALSEIDLRALCRRYGLPMPAHQQLRLEPDGRRRYLDAEWRLPDGRVIAVEVDGAHHLDPRQKDDDDLRQNEIVIGATVVLRYSSVLLRTDPARVARQLARALGVSVSS